MGNNASSNNKAVDAASGAYSPTPREENIYDQSFPPGPPNSRYGGPTSSAPSSHQTHSHPILAHSMSSVTPPIPPRGLERRSYTMVSREKRPESTSVSYIQLSITVPIPSMMGRPYLIHEGIVFMVLIKHPAILYVVRKGWPLAGQIRK